MSTLFYLTHVAVVKVKKVPYYIGLLSAAQYYGASHQQAQIFQVVTSINRKKIICGQIHIDFIARKNMMDLPTKLFNSPKGYLKVSTPEITALDVANYPLHCGGISNVITILEEMAESMSKTALSELENSNLISPQLQRLGFLLELAKQSELASVIENILKNRTFRIVPLVAKINAISSNINKRWKININEIWESDL